MKKIGVIVNCDGEGGWTKVAYINMTQSGATCPTGLIQTSFANINHAVCGKKTSAGCSSTYFSSAGLTYNKVCGQIRGYQYRSPDSLRGLQNGIENAYVDGVSITHGKYPRQHIWTYIGGLREDLTDDRACPCNTGYTGGKDPTSTFIGSHYYCESGIEPPIIWSQVLYLNDPLWDGQQCNNKDASCCPTNSKMPWFLRSLDTDFSDDLELRICDDQGYPDEAIFLDIVELYIK